jgi:hypothetical protein
MTIRFFQEPGWKPGNLERYGRVPGRVDGFPVHAVIRTVIFVEHVS